MLQRFPFVCTLADVTRHGRSFRFFPRNASGQQDDNGMKAQPAPNAARATRPAARSHAAQPTVLKTMG